MYLLRNQFKPSVRTDQIPCFCRETKPNLFQLIPGATLGLEDGAGLDLDSMLDGATNTEENNTSEEDEDMSTTVDASDTRVIRKQLEGLEGMYSEVLKLLGVRKQRPRYQPSDPRVNKRRLYGSLSSLPSSVSSRPVQHRRRHDDRKKVRDFEVSRL